MPIVHHNTVPSGRPVWMQAPVGRLRLWLFEARDVSHEPGHERAGGPGATVDRAVLLASGRHYTLAYVVNLIPLGVNYEDSAYYTVGAIGEPDDLAS